MNYLPESVPVASVSCGSIGDRVNLILIRNAALIFVWIVGFLVSFVPCLHASLYFLLRLARDNFKAWRQRQRDNVIDLQGPEKIVKMLCINFYRSGQWRIAQMVNWLLCTREFHV